MSKQLHEALACLRPKQFSDIPVDDLAPLLKDIFAKAEFIVNSVPPPPGGSPYESTQRSRTDANGATSAAELTVSKARRPPAQGEQKKIQDAWGKPLKMSSKDAETGISVYKMAGHDRHGAWFARSSVHEGLGFAKWKRAMMREFPESLAVKGGPGEGNVRGIGGDRKLEEIEVEGIGKMEVYQLSARFPSPTSPREFITLLLTSDKCVSDTCKVNDVSPRHYIVVSIPVDHPDAPPRSGLVRGYYESVEIIREIPLVLAKSVSTTNLLDQQQRGKSRDRGSTIGFAESRGPDAKGERIDRKENAADDDPETNPVEWLMITRSDPGGGIPRFMVERNTPSSIVQDAVKFLDWACAKTDFPDEEEDKVPEIEATEETHGPDARPSFETSRSFSLSQSNGILAGVGTSIADDPRPLTFRRPSAQNTGILQSIANGVSDYVPDAIADRLPDALHRTYSSSSSSTETSSIDSFASAEQFNTTTEPDITIPPSDSATMSPSSASIKSANASTDPSSSSRHITSRELEKIEQKTKELKAKLSSSVFHHEKQIQETQSQVAANEIEANEKAKRELERAAQKHNASIQKQQDKFSKELRKLEQKRERETQKILARQKREEQKAQHSKLQAERDEWREKAREAEKEVLDLKAQVGALQRENTALVGRIGRMEGGLDVLKGVREDLESTRSGRGRQRGSSVASGGSGMSGVSGKGSARRKEGSGE